MDAQRRVEAMLGRLVDEGREIGLQVAAYLDGELVIDAWAGSADPGRGRAVDGDTLLHLFSAGKGVTATAVHVLAERGVLAYDTPIAEYWPEFGTRGKERITVRHALTHSAGVPHLPAGTSLLDLCDWDRTCAMIADLEPVRGPGSTSGYHGFTFGWLLGEVVRRADGRPFKQVVRDEVTGPLGIADSLAPMVDAAMAPRMAVHADDGTGVSTAPLSTALETSPYPYSTGPNDPRFQRACMPAGVNGSARGLARMYAALANGGELDGVRLLSPKSVAAASATAVDGVDPILGRPVTRALGYALGEPGSPMAHRSAFGHQGTGGAIGFADPTRNFAFALTKNNLTHDNSATGTANIITREVRTTLNLSEPSHDERRTPSPSDT
ncbi:serine hydrolase domain-containing protein [Embleya sp. NBC_00896]|uniref:serine hydrolase domain-containing protein n=1 Tax=Embleya sp. NBC_00896 TaxID=2975961 RepID=UPI002F90BCE8|nr:beta-lactamase family protein [Embleya sp. NBC_00896]